ncbi:protein tma23 [Acrodontium crateriforme]|uniref:Protein tma23 n=1 Tax=Acrodontium crateriforme TaxID=150365 RepID=A0AAQ3R2Z0_9PEZI|nr:protein tma23 [Acrodontium crateriforme]
MDAKAYLESQGWRGEGHSLDQTNKGLKKPLLISKKVDVLGVGLNKHAAVNDQWWLRAFDEGLKNFGTGKQGVLSAVQQHGIHRGGLYGRFVKGEGVPGTFGDTSAASSSESSGTSTPVQVDVTMNDGDVAEYGSKKRKRSEEAKPEGQAKPAKKDEEKKRKKELKQEEKKGVKLQKAKKSEKDQAAQNDKGDDHASKKASKSKSTKKDALRTMSKDIKNDTEILESIPADKLAAYKLRAEEKGVPLEDYVLRRKEKKQDKQATKNRKASKS